MPSERVDEPIALGEENALGTASLFPRRTFFPRRVVRVKVRFFRANCPETAPRQDPAGKRCQFGTFGESVQSNRPHVLTDGADFADPRVG